MFETWGTPALDVGITHSYREPVHRELAGGDVVAVNRHEDGSITALIADISAKGSQAEAYASWLVAVFHVTSAFVSRPSEILRELNTMLSHAFYDKHAGLFASAFMFRIYPAASLVVYSSAGAEPPLLVRHSVVQGPLQGGGQVLGIDRDVSYLDHAVRICRNDHIVAFTDGITESRRPLTRSLLGWEGVAEAVQTSMFRSSPGSDDVFSAIDRLNGGTYYDDATLLVVAAKAT
ncbi:MAG: serine/threonine-protein phosphatase [Candidatus Eremiobacteraeota bacterium]|nr:serine/threonine-protein phosphatase [Candidatus Eremiobacteraeota bacterium]